MYSLSKYFISIILYENMIKTSFMSNFPTLQHKLILLNDSIIS